jgi:hypothetical protein
MKSPLNRDHYNRSDALRAIAHHLNGMLEHRRHIEDILRQFQFDIAMPPSKPLLEALARAAQLKHTPQDHAEGGPH